MKKELIASAHRKHTYANAVLSSGVNLFHENMYAIAVLSSARVWAHGAKLSAQSAVD